MKPDNNYALIVHFDQVSSANDLARTLEESGFRIDVMDYRISENVTGPDLRLVLFTPNIDHDPTLLLDYLNRIQEVDYELDIPVEIIILNRTNKKYLSSAFRKYQQINFYRVKLLEFDQAVLAERKPWVDLFTVLQKDRALHVPPDVTRGLAEVFSNRDQIMYIGDGFISAVGGYTQRDLMHELLKYINRRIDISHKIKNSLYSALKLNNIQLVANTLDSYIKDNNLSGQTDKHLKQKFYPGDRPRGSGLFPRSIDNELLQNLSSLGHKGTITPSHETFLFQGNPDPINEEVRIVTYQSGEDLLSFLSKGVPYQLHTQGHDRSTAPLLLSDFSFEQAVEEHRAISEFLQTAFLSTPFIFLGANLEEVEAFCQAVRFRFPSNRHYAIAPVVDDTYIAKMQALESRYNILVVPYTTRSNHNELRELIGRLATELSADTPEIEKTKRQDTKSTSQLPNGQSRIKSVDLTNIGPFEELNIELHPSWNIFLGDNGVGKSTVLRAIGAVLTGKEAETFAHRLINWEKPSGNIRLHTFGENRYEIDITRKSSGGGANIRLITASALYAEGILSLGFPPLRDLNWGQLTSPEVVKGENRPVPSDLLPLVKNAPDPRINNLKDWIYSLDYQRKSESTYSPMAEKLFNKFFEIIDDITEGLTISFDSIDSNRGRILIKTDDGVGPIESISQGTISLIGWVGVLMQRLSDIHDDVSSLTENTGVVLIDEIDAHMHPLWQQSLVSALSRHFPNMQFIATTHSPLIAGGIKEGRVHFFERNAADRNIVNYYFEDAPFRGWRVDQILTHPFFHLRGARDLDTISDLAEYTDLSIIDTLDESGQTRMAELAERLGIDKPSHLERKEARKAYSLIEDFAQEQLLDLSEDQKEKVVKELKAQLLEGISGSRRPS